MVRVYLFANRARLYVTREKCSVVPGWAPPQMHVQISRAEAAAYLREYNPRRIK